ncbi:uncharacterized protein [Triticum aestivum]|uniref:uncharacterized protein n=1 Tax=Triticum aestivum TaxID=4565 RepID=UPI001D02CF90|nr:uncharacterized protein LOC123166358 [Triticum aestivum]
MIRCARLGEDRVKMAHARQLKRQFDRLDMADGETIPEFAKKLIQLVSKIRSLGITLEDEAVVERLFSAVPDRFTDIVNTIEQWGDVSAMTVQEAIRRLTAFEQNQRGHRQSGGDEGEKLMLVSRAQLEELILKEKKKGVGSSSGNKNDDQDRRGGGRGQDGKKKERRGKFDKSRITCFQCGEKGHFASECEEPKKEKALLADAGDDEPALLMAVASELAPVLQHAADVVQPEGIEVKKVLCPLAIESELEAVKAEANRLRGELVAAQVKLHAMSKEYSAQIASRDGDHTLLLECVNALEEDARLAREENGKLLEVQRVLREENNGLHDMVKKLMARALPASAAIAASAPVAVTPAVKSPGVEMPAMESLDVETPVVKELGVQLKVKEKVCSEGHLQSVEVPDVVLLNEEKIKTKLSADERYNGELWYVDTGASNHMFGCSKIFTELDSSVNGTVCFGDGSVVQICGRGTVLHSCRSGKQHVLKDVYFIPKLRSNIISLGQLDEEGCKSGVFHGHLNFFGGSGELLAKAHKTKNRLYALNLKESVCLPNMKKCSVPGEGGCYAW